MNVMKVLFVCLGNICRSPTAEAVLTRMVEDGAELGVEVDSAGTAAYHIGKAPDPRSQAAALLRGMDMSQLKARKATKADFNEFDFIFAMDQENYSNLLEIKPEGCKASLQLFLKQYGTLGVTEVPDPYYGEEDGFEVVLDLLEDGCHQFLKSISHT